jgi:hypothetical protein
MVTVMNTVPAQSNLLLLFWVVMSTGSWLLAILWWTIYRVNRDTAVLAWGWSMFWFGFSFAINAAIRNFAHAWAYELIYVQRTMFTIGVAMAWMAAYSYLSMHRDTLGQRWRCWFPWLRGT